MYRPAFLGSGVACDKNRTDKDALCPDCSVPGAIQGYSELPFLGLFAHSSILGLF